MTRGRHISVLLILGRDAKWVPFDVFPCKLLVCMLSLCYFRRMLKTPDKIFNYRTRTQNFRLMFIELLSSVSLWEKRSKNVTTYQQCHSSMLLLFVEKFRKC